MFPSEKKMYAIVEEAFQGDDKKIQQMMDGPSVEKFKNEILKEMGVMSDHVYLNPDKEKIRESAATVKRLVKAAEKLAYVQMEGFGNV